MAKFTLYQHPNPRSGSSYQRDEIVKTGFSWAALFFPSLWALWASLWLQFLVAFGLAVVIVLVTNEVELYMLIIFNKAIIGGSFAISGYEWRMCSLEKRKYLVVGSVEARSLAEAKLKLYAVSKAV